MLLRRSSTMKTAALLFILGYCHRSVALLFDTPASSIWASVDKGSVKDYLTDARHRHGDTAIDELFGSFDPFLHSNQDGLSEQSSVSRFLRRKEGAGVSERGWQSFFRGSDTVSRTDSERRNLRLSRTTTHELAIRLLCSRELEDAGDEVTFNTAKFVTDLDTNYDLILQLQEGNVLSDNVRLDRPTWMSEATTRYDQSSRAAFAMFDLLDVDRSGYITRGDFVHKLIDTDFDGSISVCEEIEHLSRAASLAEDYRSLLKKQGSILWSRLYDPNFVLPSLDSQQNHLEPRSITTGDDTKVSESPSSIQNEIRKSTESVLATEITPHETSDASQPVNKNKNNNNNDDDDITNDKDDDDYTNDDNNDDITKDNDDDDYTNDNDDDGYTNDNTTISKDENPAISFRSLDASKVTSDGPATGQNQQQQAEKEVQQPEEQEVTSDPPAMSQTSKEDTETVTAASGQSEPEPTTGQPGTYRPTLRVVILEDVNGKSRGGCRSHILKADIRILDCVRDK